MKKTVRRQSGSILLALMLIMVVAASFTLVSKLNSSTRSLIRNQTTMETLQRAKAALIAYAVTYPEQSGTTDLDAGPGYMPCPDTNFPPNGSPNPYVYNCDESIDRHAGRFPGNFLGVSNFTDASGERIWYAISDKFRNIGNKFRPINSDTSSGLWIDTNNDGVGDIEVAAVLIAPGPPVDTIAQNRPSNLITDYLEGENADGDAVFAQNSGGGNDILVYITTQELMSAVEKRVLGDVAQAIKTYQANQGAFPWLSPFVAPNTSSFRGQPLTYQGPLPFHWAADPNSISNGGTIAGRNPFTTNIQVSWDINNATIADSDPDDLINNQVLTNSAYTDPIFGANTPVNVTNAQCTWSNRTSVNCTGSVSITVSCPNLCGGGNGTCTRTYQFNLQYSGTPTINNPTNSAVRTRDVVINNSALPLNTPVSWSIRVDDSYLRHELVNSGWGPYCSWWNINRIGTKNLTIDAGTTGTINTQGIQYDIDLDGVDLNGDGEYTDSEISAGVDLNGDGDQLDVEVAPELPQWFAANNWQDLIYLVYAGGEPLPGSTIAGQDCDTLGGCLMVAGKQSVSNVRAVVIDAGLKSLKTDNVTIQARPSASLDDYFEGGNEAIINTIIKNNWSSNFNDQLRIIATAP